MRIRTLTSGLVIAVAVILGSSLLRSQTQAGPSWTPVTSGTTAAIGGGALLAGACNTTTVAITGATTGMVAAVSPSGGTAVGAGVTWFGQVTSAGTVTVSECALLGVTPASTTFNVRVIP